MQAAKNDADLKWAMLMFIPCIYFTVVPGYLIGMIKSSVYASETGSAFPTVASHLMSVGGGVQVENYVASSAERVTRRF